MGGAASAAAESEIWGDLYSVYRAVRDCPDIRVNHFAFQNLKGDSFSRPSFLVKLVTARNRSRNIATRWMDMDVMVQYYTTTEWDAIAMAEKVMSIFSGFPEAFLPKYDFSGEIPRKISITGVDQNGQQVPSAMGIRVDPESVKSDIVETEDENFQAAVTFTMVSPRRAPMDLAPFLTAASFEVITQALDLPTRVEMHAQTALTATVL